MLFDIATIVSALGFDGVTPLGRNAIVTYIWLAENGTFVGSVTTVGLV